jgi:anthranilate phosphoribosyltransferase
VDVRVDSGPLLDTCGTGGDGGCTFNISTVAAFVVAGAGVRVAKHGNRSLSSLCGSADLLEELGIDLLTSPEQVARAIGEVGIGFMFAPAFHPAMQHAQPARLELKMRTVFNLLGPLTNPAGANCQLIGASSADVAQRMARALAELNVERAFVVHGSGSMDEITTTGPTTVFEVCHQEVREFSWSPSDFGVDQVQIADLAGGDRSVNRQIAIAVLEGERGPRRDIVLVNASAALLAAGVVTDVRAGMRLAEESVDSGAARDKVEQLARISRR